MDFQIRALPKFCYSIFAQQPRNFCKFLIGKELEEMVFRRFQRGWENGGNFCYETGFWGVSIMS